MIERLRTEADLSVPSFATLLRQAADHIEDLDIRNAKLELQSIYQPRHEVAESRETRRLREALQTYGKHPESCPKGTGVGYYKPRADAVCNCGIDQALLVSGGGET